MSAGRAVFYGFMAYSMISFAIKDQGSGSSDKRSRDVTADALGWPAGQWLVGIAGLVIAGAGVWIFVQAARRSFHKHLKHAQMSRRTRKVIDVLGVVGGVARGTLFAVAGVFAVRAALDSDASQAKGMDDTLRSFADTAAGPWLVAAIAVGLDAVRRLLAGPCALAPGVRGAGLVPGGPRPGRAAGEGRSGLG